MQRTGTGYSKHEACVVGVRELNVPRLKLVDGAVPWSQRSEWPSLNATAPRCVEEEGVDKLRLICVVVMRRKGWWSDLDFSNR